MARLYSNENPVQVPSQLGRCALYQTRNDQATNKIGIPAQPIGIRTIEKRSLVDLVKDP